MQILETASSFWISSTRYPGGEPILPAQTEVRRQNRFAEAHRNGIRIAVSYGMTRRVLLVEDDEMLQSAMATHFSAQGFEVDCAREREQAEAMMTHLDYHLLITDLGLTPFGLNGFDVLDFTWHRYPRPKVIVLTGYGSPSIEDEARFRGVDAFLRKPQSLRTISDLAKKLLGDSHAN